MGEEEEGGTSKAVNKEDAKEKDLEPTSQVETEGFRWKWRRRRQ